MLGRVGVMGWEVRSIDRVLMYVVIIAFVCYIEYGVVYVRISVV
jgi:hypothetical protein